MCCSLVFEQIKPLTRMVEPLSSKWVALQCLSKLEPLTSMVNQYCTQTVIYLYSLILSVYHWLTFLEAKALAVILKSNFHMRFNNPGLSFFKNFYVKQKLSLPLYAGLLNAFLPVWLFINHVSILISTALLICMENSFWTISGDVNFVDSFKTSFTLYVESGMRKKMEEAIDILGNECPDYKEVFYKIIIEHYLRKFLCFQLHLTHLKPMFSSHRPWRSNLWVGTKEWNKAYLAAKVKAQNP